MHRRSFIDLQLNEAVTSACVLIHRVHGNGSGLPELLHQGSPLAAVCGCHGDGLQNAVSPVDVAVDPVYCNTFWSLNPAADHDVVTRGVSGLIHPGAVGRGQQRRLIPERLLVHTAELKLDEVINSFCRKHLSQTTFWTLT